MDMSEIKTLVEAQAAAWEQFKSANDARIKAIETKGYAPADLEAKVGTINADVSKLSGEIADIIKKMQRPGATGADGKTQLSAEQVEHQRAFGTWLREGKSDGLAELERKAMNTGSKYWWNRFNACRYGYDD